MVGVVAALVAGAAWLSIDEAEQRFFASAACGLPGVNSADVRRAGGRVYDWVAAHARLVAQTLRTPRPAHGTVGLGRRDGRQGARAASVRDFVRFLG